MYKEKNIPKLIIFVPIVIIVLLSSSLLYSMIIIQENYLNNEVKEFKNKFLNKQKSLLKKEILSIYKYIDFHKKNKMKEIKSDLTKQILNFYNKIKKDNFLSENYLNLIEKYSLEYSDIIVYDIEKDLLIKNNDVFFKKETIEKIKKTIKKDKFYFEIKYKTNLFLYMYFPQKELIICIKRDIFNDIDILKTNIAKWVENLRFLNNNYFFIYSNTNILLSHPYRRADIGKDYTEVKNWENPHLVQKFVKMAISNPDGAIIEHLWNKENESDRIKRYTFVKLYKEWNWVLCAGIYMDDIQLMILSKKNELNKTIINYKKKVIFISLIIIFLSLLISLNTSKKINEIFEKYREKVNNREDELKNLNKNLNKKVLSAIKQSKEKDRTLYHQARLAEIGTLMNMISHQWRQPLSQISGIIMEMETIIEFKKLKKKDNKKSLKKINIILEHMSLTIEDFRNFFKPESKKEEFSVSSACNDAISLIKDALSNKNIKLQLIVKSDVKIYGYKREYSQVILNMLVNAKDQLDELDIKNKYIEVQISLKSNKSLVSISDNAGGIKAKNIEIVFEPYYSTKKNQGTGLGLYIGKMIIEKNMNGKITAQNNNNGAIFLIEV